MMRIAIRALIAGLCVTLCAVSLAGSPGADSLSTLTQRFEQWTGSRLVFSRRHLKKGEFFDRMPALSGTRRKAAVRLLLKEAVKYPKGYFGTIGLKTVAVFRACVSKSGDGFRPYESALGGYRYFGMWNGQDAMVAAYYSNQQLPLTFHHEVFHHVDATRPGAGVSRKESLSDDRRFNTAISGVRPYAVPKVLKQGLRALRSKSQGIVLLDAVSRYASKHPGEDQAETARHVMTTLPDALLQVVEKPRLAGSQRILHILKAYRKAAAKGPGMDFFLRIALGRTPLTHSEGPLRKQKRVLVQSAEGPHEKAAQGIQTYHRPSQIGGRSNPYLRKVNRAIRSLKIRYAIRRVQPATVRIAIGGSGVNLHPDGLILTAGHVPDYVGRKTTIRFPDGRSFQAICTVIDKRLDLALLRVEGAGRLPVAQIAAKAAPVGVFVAVVGQPGTTTPGGEPTGYQPFHVSTGQVRGYLPNPLGRQSLGRMKHDAWTYWGHSGSPLFDRHGFIVGIHNSWDSRTAMRHAVPHQAMRHFLIKTRQSQHRRKSRIPK
jgi:hypothetical protein